MYGLEKKKSNEPFSFDLEEELKNDPLKKKEYMQKVEKQIDSIKKKLRAGQKEEGFEQLGILLQGYSTFLKILKKIKTKEN